MLSEDLYNTGLDGLQYCWEVQGESNACLYDLCTANYEDIMAYKMEQMAIMAEYKDDMEEEGEEMEEFSCQDWADMITGYGYIWADYTVQQNQGRPLDIGQRRKALKSGYSLRAPTMAEKTKLKDWGMDYSYGIILKAASNFDYWLPEEDKKEDMSYCMYENAMSWNYNDVTDMNSAYPGSLVVQAYEPCQDVTVDLEAGTDYTPDDGCAW